MVSGILVNVTSQATTGFSQCPSRVVIEPAVDVEVLVEVGSLLILPSFQFSLFTQPPPSYAPHLVAPAQPVQQLNITIRNYRKLLWSLSKSRSFSRRKCDRALYGNEYCSNSCSAGSFRSLCIIVPEFQLDLLLCMFFRRTPFASAIIPVMRLWLNGRLHTHCNGAPVACTVTEQSTNLLTLNTVRWCLKTHVHASCRGKFQHEKRVKVELYLV